MCWSIRSKKSNDAETTAQPSIAPTETANATLAPTESAAPAVTASPAATENAAATASPEATEAPTEKPTAKPTVAPTSVVSVDLKPKPAGEATVYYKKGGKRYHMTENCSGMKNAPAGTLADAVSANYKSCSSCKSPDPAILEAEDVAVWADENNLFHLSDECTNFTGTWSLMTLVRAGKRLLSLHDLQGRAVYGDPRADGEEYLRACDARAHRDRDGGSGSYHAGFRAEARRRSAGGIICRPENGIILLQPARA